MLFFSSKKRLWFFLIPVLLCVLLAGLLSRTSYPRRLYKRVEREWLILTGGLIDVGGYYVRISCWGSGRTVVFDSGLSQPRETWGTVPDEIAKLARVCTYDRAGVGDSDDADFTRTAADTVRELRTLLEKAGEKGPFILVGHSFGGLNALLYGMTYPDDVDGLVLVEPSHPDQYEKIAASKQEPERSEYLRHEGGENGERLDLLTSGKELKNSTAVSTLPNILLTAKSNPLGYLYDDSSINRSISRSGAATFSDHIVVENSGHFVQQDRPDVVINAVMKMLSYTQGSEVTQRTK